MSQLLDGMSPLPHLGVIRVEGDDAATFLQGQLTQDFVSLGPGEARLAAFCSAKGRMQASFVGVQRGPTEILLVCSADILPATLKRLSMFVLRAKARLTDASALFDLCGLCGDTAMAVLPQTGAPWSKTDVGGAHVVRLYPADGAPRALWIAPTGEPRPAGPALLPQLWLWSEVRSGVAMVTAPVVDAFVPQMLNYESIGGVNFKKGCYPGQEVVARSQFRGTLKRRAFVAHCEAGLAAGQELFHASDAEQPCGTVAQAAPAPGGGWDAIVSMQVAAAQGGVLFAGRPDGPQLTLLPLPYLLMTDV
jgi:folate-binding protein YgfZ